MRNVSYVWRPWNTWLAQCQDGRQQQTLSLVELVHGCIGNRRKMSRTSAQDIVRWLWCKWLARFRLSYQINLYMVMAWWSYQYSVLRSSAISHQYCCWYELPVMCAETTITMMMRMMVMIAMMTMRSRRRSKRRIRKRIDPQLLLYCHNSLLQAHSVDIV